MRLLAVHTVPVWDEHGNVHVCGPDEVRPDLEHRVIGWANLLVMDIEGEQHTLLAVDDR
jgi:hypothetical protein